MQASDLRGAMKSKSQGTSHQFQLYFSSCWLATLKQFRMSQAFSLLGILWDFVDCSVVEHKQVISNGPDSSSFLLLAQRWVGSKQWAFKLHLFWCALMLCKTVIRPESVLMALVPALAVSHNPSTPSSLSKMCFRHSPNNLTISAEEKEMVVWQDNRRSAMMLTHWILQCLRCACCSC